MLDTNYILIYSLSSIDELFSKGDVTLQINNTFYIPSATWIKCLVYGESGTGKTTLATTMPKPIILSSEGGLMSVREYNLPYVDILTWEDFHGFLSWIKYDPAAKDFDSIILDSVSDLGTRILAAEKAKTANPQKAYGETIEKVKAVVNELLLLSKHVLVISQLERDKDADGVMITGPTAPGRKAIVELPYPFDFVFKMEKAKTPDGADTRVLLTNAPGSVGKDRSRKLPPTCPAHIGWIIQQIQAVPQQGV